MSAEVKARRIGQSLEIVKNLLRLMRPLQWTKNIFVFSGFIFSSTLDGLSLFLSALLAAISFCLASSTAYIFNDIFDRESDRYHPKKRSRPIASHAVSVEAAALLAAVTGAAGLYLASSVSNDAFLLLSLYLLMNILYTLFLKHIVIVDVFCISSGFMLRILAGTKGVGIPPSRWLLLCGLMITLFLGFTKRRAEISTFSEGEGARQRHVLLHYSKDFLDNIISISASCTIITYSLYAMSASTINTHNTENLIFTVPFVAFALFRYMFNLHHSNSAGDPATDLFKDKHILAAVLLWILSSLYFIKGP